MDLSGEDGKVMCEYIDGNDRLGFVREQMDTLRQLRCSDDIFTIPMVGSDARALGVQHRSVTGERFRSFEGAVAEMGEDDSTRNGCGALCPIGK